MEAAGKMTLQVLVSAYGKAGIERVAAAAHPEMEGVGYLVLWQHAEGDVPKVLQRTDHEVVRLNSVGLSRSRNEAMDLSRGEWVLFSDDDIDYTEEGLRRVLEGIRENPDCDFLTFRFENPKVPKQYLVDGFRFPDVPKGYYLSSVELAIKRNVAERADLCFDDRFGAGSGFLPCGEEELFLWELQKAGMRGTHVAQYICRHEGETTASRCRGHHDVLMAKGAVLSRLHPFSWALRLMKEGWTKEGFQGALRYLSAGAEGIALCLRRRRNSFRRGRPKQSATPGSTTQHNQ